MASRVVAPKRRRGARKHNALKVKSSNRFLLRKKASIVGSTEKKRRSKVHLNDKEVALLKKTLQPLIPPKPVVSKVKEGIEPGRVVILLGGAHRGKHAVVLKVLESGLLLVTGPHKVNGLPLRRVHQMFTIVTSTKIDLSKVNVPAEINDAYFRKPVERRTRGARGAKSAEGEANIFSKRRVEYQLTQSRKDDQIKVDKAVLEAIKQHPEKEFLVPYLASHFYLKNKQYPHKMKF